MMKQSIWCKSIEITLHFVKLSILHLYIVHIRLKSRMISICFILFILISTLTSSYGQVTCASGWVQNGGSCYVIYPAFNSGTIAGTWDQCNNYCRTSYPGATMLCVDNAGLNCNNSSWHWPMVGLYSSNPIQLLWVQPSSDNAIISSFNCSNITFSCPIIPFYSCSILRSFFLSYRDPSLRPSTTPSSGPSTFPSSGPSTAPSFGPSTVLSSDPLTAPSFGPSVAPTSHPTVVPSLEPTSSPTPTPSFWILSRVYAIPYYIYFIMLPLLFWYKY